MGVRCSKLSLCWWPSRLPSTLHHSDLGTTFAISFQLSHINTAPPADLVPYHLHFVLRVLLLAYGLHLLLIREWGFE